MQQILRHDSYMRRILLLPVLLLLFTVTGCTLFNWNNESDLSREEIDTIKAKSERLRSLGREWREKANFATALDYQTQALEYSMKVNDTISIVKDYNQLGTTFRRLGRLEQALNYHYQALTYAEACSDTSSVARKNLVVSLNGLGNVYLTLDDDEMAEKCFRRAFLGESALNSHLGMAINYANIGSIFERRNQLDSARWYYEHSLKHNELSSSNMGIALCHIYFGNLYEKTDSLKAAEKEFRLAAEMMEGNEDLWHAVEPFLSLGRNLIKQGKLDEADEYATRSFEVAKELNSFEHLQEATALMADIAEHRGNYQSALEYFRQSSMWQDSLRSGENDNKIRSICIEYEQRQTNRKMQQLQEAYDANDYMNNIVFWVELALLILALIAMGLIFYAAQNRKTRLEAMSRLEKMRTTFFRNITHEFRTPLTVILGLSQQLKNEDLSQQQRNHFLDSIDNQGRSLLETVNQLLSLSKLMAGFGNFKWRHGDIIAFLRMTMSGYSDFAQMRNIQLEFVTSQNNIEMDFVPEFYEKIMSNLLGNAFKYTPSGGSITVQVELKEKHLVLDVIDTGIGISEEDLPHIFEMFYMSKLADKQGSSGIGLSFVNQMVHQMGGIIAAKPNLPRGTVIEIIVSTKCHDHEAEITPWAIADAVSSNSGNRLAVIPGMNDMGPADGGELEMKLDDAYPLVLIVEDNNDIAEYIALLLNANYRVIKACDGYDALRKAGQQLPDLIITDLMMPGMDGYELCHSIRQSQVLSDVPIMIVSARSEDKDRVKGYEDGADAYLLKPFNPAELKAMISRLLDQRRRSRLRMQNLIADVENNASAHINLSEEVDFDVRKYLQQIQEVVDRQMLQGDMQLDTIARLMGTSRSTLARRIKLVTGCAPSAYILQLRLDHACHLLTSTDLSIGEISLSCGFEDMSYFSRVFRQNFDITPSQYRASKQNK